jgi:PAS domain S-box-containing protein/putative nucleotidyltransferase with HDIG domain
VDAAENEGTLRSLLRLVGFLDTTAIGFAYFDEDGVIRDANQTVATMVGLDSHDLRGRKFSDPAWHTVHEDGSDFYFSDLYDPSGGVAHAQVALIMGLDFGPSQRRWLAVDTFPVDADHHRGVIATFADITDKIDQHRLLEILSEVNRFAVAATEEDDAIQHLCDVLVAPGRHALAWVGTVSGDTPGGVDIMASAGMTDYLYEGMVTWSGTDPRGLGPGGTTLRTGEARAIHDLAADPLFAPWRDRAHEFGFSSIATLPFYPGGRRSVIAVYDTHRHAFNSQVMNKLETVAREVEYTITHIRSVAQLAASLDGTLAALSRLTETRDPYTAGHQRRVGDLASAIAAKMGLDETMVTLIRQAGQVHDVGKTAIPAEILTRPGRISALDFELVKTHCEVGADILEQASLPWPIAEVARSHHERIDGSGYPRGLARGEIILPARIVAVADVVEAMTHHRPYRAGLGIDAALAEIARGADVIYDEEVAHTCLELFNEGFSFAPL